MRTTGPQGGYGEAPSTLKQLPGAPSQEAGAFWAALLISCADSPRSPLLKPHMSFLFYFNKGPFKAQKGQAASSKLITILSCA